MTKPSVFPPTQWDSRPWTLVYLAVIVGAVIFGVGYVSGQYSRPNYIIVQSIDSIPIPPDAILCLQHQWIKDNAEQN